MPFTWSGVVAQNRSWGALAYSPTLGLWIAGSGAASFTTNARFMSSTDDAASWGNVNGGSPVWIANLNGDGLPQSGLGYRGILWDPFTSQFIASSMGQDPSTGNPAYVMVYVSADGLTWTRKLVYTFNDGGHGSFRSNPIIATNGAGTYVIAWWNSVEATEIFYCTDLTFTTWTRVTLPANLLPGSMLYAGGQFVIVGPTVNSSNVLSSGVPIQTSPDGITWTGHKGFEVGFQATRWTGLTYGSNGYVAVAENINGAGAVMTSGDAAAWTLGTMPTITGLHGALPGWVDVTYLAGVGYLAINGNAPGLASEGSAISTDALSWNLLTTPKQNPPGDPTTITVFNSLAVGNHNAVALSQSASLYHVLTLLAPQWYYNPDTNQYQFGENPGPPWIPQNPTLTIDCGGISPNTGYDVGGILVTIPGTGFGEGATVTFGGVAATSVTVVDANTITVILPAHAAGAVDVTVTNLDGTTFTCPNGFTYITPTTISFTGANLSLTQAQAGPGGTGGGSWVTKECTGKTGSPRTGV